MPITVRVTVSSGVTGVTPSRMANEAPAVINAATMTAMPATASGLRPSPDAVSSRTEPGAGGEIQITDVIDLLIDEGHPVHVVVHRGKRHDLGNPGGYIPANVDFGLRDEKYGPALYTAVKKIIADFEEEHPEVKEDL